MSDQNKSISRRLIEEGFNRGNLSVVDELIADNYANHDTPPGLPAGREGIKQFISMYRAAFPDLYTTIDDQIADGDKVVTRWTGQGTNTGSMMGMPPTGKAMKITGIVIDRIVGGRIVETWNTFDQLGMMQQLGLVPAGPGARADADQLSSTRPSTRGVQPGMDMGA